MEQSRMSVERKWEERIERKKERKIEEPGAAFCDMQSSASNHNHGDPAAVMRARVDRKESKGGLSVHFCHSWALGRARGTLAVGSQSQ